MPSLSCSCQWLVVPPSWCCHSRFIVITLALSFDARHAIVVAPSSSYRLQDTVVIAPFLSYSCYHTFVLIPSLCHRSLSIVLILTLSSYFRHAAVIAQPSCHCCHAVVISPSSYYRNNAVSVWKCCAKLFHKGNPASCHYSKLSFIADIAPSLRRHAPAPNSEYFAWVRRCRASSHNPSQLVLAHFSSQLQHMRGTRPRCYRSWTLYEPHGIAAAADHANLPGVSV